MSCNDKNSLVREGTSLSNRVLAALNTNYAKADERQAADIILFAKRYAAFLNFYDASNTLSGDWQTIMKMDACVALAELFKIESRKNYEYKLLLYKQIKLASIELTGATDKTKKQFKFLFDFIFSLVKFIDEQFRLIPADLSKKDILSGAISNKMSEALSNMVAFYQIIAAPAPGLSLVDTTITSLDETNAPVDLLSCSKFDRSGLDSVWTTTPPLSISIPAKTASFTEKDQIVWLINHNLFNAQIDNIFKGIAFLATRAEEIFNQVTSGYPKHSPHYALFLSFTKLFRIAQDDLNRYTQRHLDFYYKDVLQLKNKAPQPDTAHLTFELQKTVSQQLLLKDTLFKGGKDITGKEIKYALTEDLVLNKASIDKIHSWQLTAEPKKILKASVIANSDNGEDPAISTADKSWFTFGDTNKIKNAEVGFGIASNILFLNEGKRIVVFQVNFINAIPGYDTLATDCFKANLTGIKGWHQVNGLEVKFNSGRELNFKFTLEASDPAIVPYNEKIHKSKLDIDLPLLQVYLDQKKASAIPYTLLCNKKLSSVDITVDVNRVKDLSLSHDNGPIDPAKPFKPFGDFPGNNASFYIGSKEIFQKKLSSLVLDLNWKDSTPTLNQKVSLLNNNNWNSDYDIEADGKTISFESKEFKKTKRSFDKNELLQINSIEGFLRIRLNSTEYSYDTYLNDVKTQISNTTLKKDEDGAYHLTVTAMPVQREAILKSFALNYFATTNIEFTPGELNKNDLFLHFSPFGYYQVNPDHVSASSNAEAVEHISMLPDIIHAGELFIGFGNAEPASVINVLFQVADGSSNPLKDIETVSWYYLAKHNNWKLFKKQDIIDRTNNFTEPGIVTVTLPHKISNTNTAFEKGLYWIKAVVENNTDAVCKMIMVQAQAVQVKLQQDEARQIEFRQTLPANSISKLVIGNSAVKTITQPFDSFAGRVREQDEHFYVRISERLRHKQRAINIWDYEHMILEEFQSIFKVKCLNHSGFYMEQGEEVFCENYPGHVTIITIPDQKHQTNINPLKPYTPTRILNNITEFLKRSDSPFVKLHVKNPQFEEIQLDFQVKFNDHLDEAFYLQLLNTEIEKFLCPWAWDQAKEISFGGKIVKSVLLNFIEERSYVDYVTCFRMNHIIKRNGTVHVMEKQDVEEATASTSRSLLVSYFNEETNVKHMISSPALCDC